MSERQFTFPDSQLNRFYELGSELMDAVGDSYDECPASVQDAFETLASFHAEWTEET